MPMVKGEALAVSVCASLKKSTSIKLMMSV